MKLKKLLFTFTIIFTLILGISCKDKKPKPVEFEPTAISTVLTTYDNKQDVRIQGIVYGVTKNGFYIADSTDAGVFVVMGDSWTPDVEIGDNLQVTGKYSRSETLLQINNVTKVTGISKKNQLPVTALNLTISQINELDHTNKTGSYGKLITLTATIEADSASNLILKDDLGSSIVVHSHSNPEINKYAGKRVIISVITYRYDANVNAWILSFAGKNTDIKEDALSFESIVQMAKDHIESVVPSEIFGALVLPRNHPIFKNITYSWSVETNEYVSLEGSNVVIVFDEIDHTVKFTVTISDGTNHLDVEYNITSKAIVEQSLSNLLANIPLVNMSTVRTSGIVVAISRNQSLSLRSLVIQDPTTKETLVVDFSNRDDGFISNTSELFRSVKMGDLVKITGQFDNENRQSIENVSGLEIISSDNPVVHDIENAYELSNKENYENFGTNYRDYTGKLVKIINPFLNYSTSSTPTDTNWVRIGYDGTSGNNGFGVPGDTHVFAFLIAAQNEALGDSSWHTNYDIPFINAASGAKQYSVTYYVYLIYYEGSSYMQFIIPNNDCIEVVGMEKINLDLAKNVPSYVDPSVTSALELPETHQNAGQITWQSSNEAVVSSAGIIGIVEKSTNVTLTASYTFDGSLQEVTFNLTVLPVEAETATSVLMYEEPIYVKLRGVVVSFVSDGNTVDSRNGVLVLDKDTGATVIVTNLNAIGGTIGNYVDNNGKTIKIGDEIILTGRYALDAPAIGSGPVQTGRNSVELSATSLLLVEVEDVQFDYHLENAVVINNHQELIEFTQNVQYGTILKIVGTTENPIYIGGSASKLPFNLKIFYTADGMPANTVDAAKYDGTIYSLKSDVVGYTYGASWYTNIFGIPGAFVGPNASNSGVAITGEIYVAVCYRTSTYFQMCAIAMNEWIVNRDGSLDDVRTFLDSAIPSAIVDGEQDFVLPIKTIYTEGTIIWTSSNPELFNIETMTAVASLTDMTITLQATFVFQNEEQVLTFELTILGLGEPELLQISTLIASANDGTVQKTEGVLVSYHSDGNTSGELRGIILKDLTTSELLLVDGMQKFTPVDVTFTHGEYYASDGSRLEIGDRIEIMGTFSINGTRKSILVDDSSYITIVSKNSPIMFGEPVVTVSNDLEMASFAANLQVGVLVKFVGTEDNPFCFGGSSTTPSSINYKFFYNAAALINDDVKYLVSHGTVIDKLLTFSFKGQVNVPTLGENWWDTYFGLPAGFVGPKDPYLPYTYSGTIYAVVSAVTSTYVQMSFINISEIMVTQLQSGAPV